MKRRILALLISAFLIFCIVGCDDNKDNEPQVEVSFPEDTLFAVNDVPVTEGEWNLYALPEIEKIGRLYGEDVWKYSVDADGKKFLDVMKEDIKRKIISIKIVAGKAESFGISLTEDDLVEISIQTADYMDKLTPSQQKEYKITEDIVKKVYADNLLATKVYEHLTLNIDTSTDEEQVRHMELQFITVSKGTEDKDGNLILYSENEIEGIRARLSQYVTAVKAMDEAKLSDVNNDEFTVTTIIAGLDDLKERFPEDLAGVAFWLRDKEVSKVYETDEAFFVFDCINLTDKEATDAARVKIIEQREKDVFDAEYDKWEAEAKIIN